MVPFVDLTRTTRPIMAEVNAAMASVVERNAYILGSDVKTFEGRFAAYCETAHAVGLDTGTSALELCLRAWGIGEGDEVITVPNTFIATASGIAFTGATPVFVDISPATYCMDVAQLEAAITPRTRAIIPVHLYGQPADMDPIMAIARANGLRVLEDACQAHGARYKGRRCGSLGHAAAFSFYPAKNLGGFGDGGALVTDDAELADHVRMLRNYGQRVKYEHLFLAYNRRLDTLQAAVLDAKLPHLDDWNASRRAAAERYGQLLATAGLALPTAPEYAQPVHHLYVVRTSRRDEVSARLTAADVSWGLHYPIPIYLQPAYEYLGHKRGDFPEAERACDEVLSLPMFPGMRDEELEAVAAALG